MISPLKPEWKKHVHGLKIKKNFRSQRSVKKVMLRAHSKHMKEPITIDLFEK